MPWGQLYKFLMPLGIAENNIILHRGGSRADGERSKEKYFSKLKNAMLQSYNNHNGQHNHLSKDNWYSNASTIMSKIKTGRPSDTTPSCWCDEPPARSCRCSRILRFWKGYLPVREIENLTSAYSTVYHLGLDKGEINSAINFTRTTDIRC